MAEALAHGDFEGHGFRAFFERHYDFVWRSLKRLGVPEAQVEDGVQEVFLTLHRKGGEFRGEASERVWVYAFARRMAATMRRTEARRARRTRALFEAQLAAETGHAGRQPLEAHLAATRMLEGLRESDREIVILVELEGMSGPELAKLLRVSTGAAYGRIRLARARARTLLGETEPESSHQKGHAALCVPLFPAKLAASLTAVMGPPMGAMAQTWAQIASGIPASTQGLLTGTVAKLGLSAWGSGAVKVGVTAVATIGVLVTSLGGQPAAMRDGGAGSQQFAVVEEHRETPYEVVDGPELRVDVEQSHARTNSSTKTMSSLGRGTVESRRIRKSQVRARPSQAKGLTEVDDVALIREHQLLEASVIAYRRGLYEQTLAGLARARQELGQGALQRERNLLQRRAECQLAARSGSPRERQRCAELR